MMFVPVQQGILSDVSHPAGRDICPVFLSPEKEIHGKDFQGKGIKYRSATILCCQSLVSCTDTIDLVVKTKEPRFVARPNLLR